MINNYGATDHMTNDDEIRPLLESRQQVDLPVRPYSRLVRFRRHLWADVDPEQSTIPLVYYCFMTGFMDAITFNAVKVWCGFQTGNTIQLSLAVARLFSIPEIPGPTLRIGDQQTLASITSFLGGAFLGRIGDRIGNKTRIWLFLGTLLQALFTLLAATFLFKGRQSRFGSEGDAWFEPEGFAALALASASMGLQGIMGKRVNTQFATTIVLTTVWCELMAEPALFAAKLVRSRDLKIVAVTTLFAGGFLGSFLINIVGDAETLGIGTAFRVIIAFLWLCTPSKKAAVQK